MIQLALPPFPSALVPVDGPAPHACAEARLRSSFAQFCRVAPRRPRIGSAPRRQKQWPSTERFLLPDRTRRIFLRAKLRLAVFRSPG